MLNFNFVLVAALLATLVAVQGFSVSSDNQHDNIMTKEQDMVTEIPTESPAKMTDIETEMEAESEPVKSGENEPKETEYKLEKPESKPAMSEEQESERAETPEEMSEEVTTGKTSSEEEMTEHEESLFESLTATNSSGDVRIAGGADGAIATYPFMVSITSSASPSTRTCTGVILSTRYVLTAASCVIDATAITVRYGSVAVAADGTAVTFNTAIIHPKYSLSNKDYDIALIRMKTAIVLAATVTPINLATKSYVDDNSDLAGLTMGVLGYGPSSATGTNGPLRFVEMRVLSSSDCSRLTKGATNLRVGSSQSCLSREDGTIGLCGQYDVGAAVIYKFNNDDAYSLVGIGTYASGCTSTVPNVFTRIGPFRDWITKYTLSNNVNPL